MGAEVPHEHYLTYLDVFVAMDSAARSAVGHDEEDAIKRFNAAFGIPAGSIRVVKIAVKMQPPAHGISRKRGSPVTIGVPDCAGKILDANARAA